MRMRYLKSVCGLMLINLFNTVLAANVPAATPQDLPTDLTREQIRQSHEIATTTHTETTPNVPNLSEEDIIAQPDLLENALDTAIEQQNIRNIALLLPLYRRLPENRQNQELAQYADAILHRANNQHNQAENTLRRILANHPEYTPVRLQLAVTQAQNGQSREAAQELSQIQQDPNLPEHIVDYVQQFNQHLQQEKKWKWDTNATYLQDSNVGRTPKQRSYAGWQFSEPQSAHGIGYELAAQKTLPIKGHWAARIQASASGKFYWDAHNHDDLIVHTEVGSLWRDAKQEISLAPFYEKRWFATDPYSQTAGATARYSRNLSKKISAFSAWQSAYKKHETRHHLDGAAHSASVAMAYRHSPQQSFSFGVGAGRQNAKDLSESYTYANLNAGWTQQWGKSHNWTSSLNASALRRHYRAADFFNIKRRDTEYFTRLSLSNQNWAWRGFVPRLNWTWSHIHSNHFYYRYNQHRVFVDVSKRF